MQGKENGESDYKDRVERWERLLSRRGKMERSKRGKQIKMGDGERKTIEAVQVKEMTSLGENVEVRRIQRTCTGGEKM